MTTIQNSFLKEYDHYRPEDGNLRNWVKEIYYDDHTLKGSMQETQANYFSWIFTYFGRKTEKGDALLDLFEKILSSTSFQKEPSLRELAEIVEWRIKKEKLSDTSERAKKCCTVFQEKRLALFPEFRDKGFNLLGLPNELLPNIVQNLTVSDFCRFERSCKLGKSLKEVFLQKFYASIPKDLIQDEVKNNHFESLISHFQCFEKKSAYPLELTFSEQINHSEIRKVFSFFTNIQKLHFVNFSFDPWPLNFLGQTLNQYLTADIGYSSHDTSRDRAIYLMSQNCSSVVDFAIVNYDNDDLWKEGPVQESEPPKRKRFTYLQEKIALLALQCQSLKQLDLSGVGFTFTSTVLNSSCLSSNLERLTVLSSSIDIKAVNSVLSKCTKLKSLVLIPPRKNNRGENYQEKLTSDDFLQFLPSNSLETLNLCKSAITDKGLFHIVKSCPHLKRLDLDGCDNISIKAFYAVNGAHDTSVTKEGITRPFCLRF